MPSAHDTWTLNPDPRPLLSDLALSIETSPSCGWVKQSKNRTLCSARTKNGHKRMAREAEEEQSQQVAHYHAWLDAPRSNGLGAQSVCTLWHSATPPKKYKKKKKNKKWNTKKPSFEKCVLGILHGFYSASIIRSFYDSCCTGNGLPLFPFRFAIDQLSLSHRQCFCSGIISVSGDLLLFPVTLSPWKMRIS